MRAPHCHRAGRPEGRRDRGLADSALVIAGAPDPGKQLRNTLITSLIYRHTPKDAAVPDGRPEMVAIGFNVSRTSHKVGAITDVPPCSSGVFESIP